MSTTAVAQLDTTPILGGEVRQAPAHGQHSPWHHAPIIVLVVLTALAFILQARFLATAGAPYSDEGIYAEAGRLRLQGVAIHRDLTFWHMPLIPLLIGIGLETFHSMYWVRLVYLFTNCFSVIPLYLLLVSVSRRRGLALLASVFYLTFPEMVQDDFRFVAIRQPVNLLFILYTYLGLRESSARWVGQAVVAALSLLMFLGSAPSLFFVSLALALSANRQGRSGVFGRYLAVGLAAALPAALYLVAVPQAFDQVVLAQMSRAVDPKLPRLVELLSAPFDRVFYLTGLIGLFAATLRKELRALALAMLGSIGVAVLVPANYFPTYPVAAAPAFAFGVFGLGLALDSAAGHRAGSILATTAVMGILTVHLLIVVPYLLTEWSHRDPDYVEIIETLRKGSGPVLTIQPIYAIEAGRPVPLALGRVYTRPWALGINVDFADLDLKTIAGGSCSIVWESGLSSLASASLQAEWEAGYWIRAANRVAKVLETQGSGC